MKIINLKKIGSNGRSLDGEYLKITMSFGIALLNDQSIENSTEILSMADAALYQSKESRRNRVTISEH